MFGFKSKKTQQLESEVADLKNEVATVKNQGVSISNIEELSEALGVVSSAAGPVVNHKTSMKVSVVYACVRLIAGAIASLPLPVYENGEKGREKARSHPLYVLLNLQPTAVFSAAMFWEYIVASMLLQGDGFALIIRNRNGEPIEFLPLNPLMVQVENVNGRLVYYIELDGKWRGFDQDDVLHFAGFGFKGLRSLSVIRYAAVNSIGLAMAMEDYSSDFFVSGAHQSVAIIKQGKWDNDDRQAFREAWVRTYSGVDKRKYPLTIDKSTDIKELTVNARDSQLLEGRKFQIVDIARAFGIPSWMVNETEKSTSFGNGIAEIGLSFIRYTLQPHITRFEQELNRKLLMGSKYFVEFNSGGLVRGTIKERNEAYRQSVGGSHGPGWMTLNEVRKMENLPPLPGGDDLYNPTKQVADNA